MGSLAFISAEERPLALDIHSLSNRLVRLDISEPNQVLACVVAQSSLFEQIKARQYDDLHLVVLREMVLRGGSKEVTIGADGAMKMYRDLRQHYWRWRMRKDIVEYVARCLNCQQVKYEHQRPGGLLQQITILEWKWERITMDFVVGLPRTLWKFDAVWVIIDRLTKSAQFIPVVTMYTSERLAQIYIQEIVQLHGPETGAIGGPTSAYPRYQEVSGELPF
ncbi:uncharacterized protein [Nicotiana tomentosiformis]|uniref:uncharacterized protein n=1 Tax=Nicotiana tomentosiformis TaxID=4098 RepID=UPI00388C69E0